MEVVELLLSKGTDITTTTKSGETPFALRGYDTRARLFYWNRAACGPIQDPLAALFIIPTLVHLSSNDVAELLVNNMQGARQKRRHFIGQRDKVG